MSHFPALSPSPQSLGSRRLCRLLRFCPFSAHRAESRFTHDYQHANPSFREQRNNVKCRVLTISSTEFEESKFATGALVMVACAAGSIPALRASRLDPK